jgi:hypothetical protein
MPARNPASVLSPPVITADQIRARAYQIFLARAGRLGDPDADWLQAERELMAEASASQAVAPPAASAAPRPSNDRKKAARLG